MIKLAVLSVVLTLPVTFGVILQQGAQDDASGVSEQSQTQLGPAGIFAPGRIEGVTPEVELLPQINGRVVTIHVKEGERVEANALLVSMDDAQLRFEVEAAEAQLELAQSELERLVNGTRYEDRAEAAWLYKAKLVELERAKLDWERCRALLEKDAIAAQDADRYRTLVASLSAEATAAKARYQSISAEARPDEIKMAKARIATAEAKLELARVQLDRTQLRAPSCGQVLKLNVEPGELIGPDATTPVVVLADTSRFCVRAFVEELDACRLTEGMTATITADGLPGQELQGTVTRLSPQMSHKTLQRTSPTNASIPRSARFALNWARPPYPW